VRSAKTGDSQPTEASRLLCFVEAFVFITSVSQDMRMANHRLDKRKRARTETAIEVLFHVLNHGNLGE
jgi:hypothetical protein